MMRFLVNCSCDRGLKDTFSFLVALFLGLQTLGLQHAYPAFDQAAVSGGNQTTGLHAPPYPSGSSAGAPGLQVNFTFPNAAAATPTLLGKG